MSAMAKVLKVATDEAVWFDDLGRPMIPGTGIPIYYLIHYLGWRDPEEVMNMPIEWS
jgi:hypothetical protein